MADFELPSGGGDVNEYTRRAQAAERAGERMRELDRQRQGAEEKTEGVERRSAQTRSGLADATSQLSSALQANIGAIERETSMLNANISALERQLTLRRSIAATPIPAAAGGRGGGGGRVPPVAAAGGFEEDPGAQARYEAALSRQAQVEGRAKQAAAMYTASVRPGSESAGQSTELLAQREEMNRRLAVAKRETASAQQNLEASQAAGDLRKQELANLQRQNAADIEATAAIERAAAEANAVATARASQAVSARAPLQLGPGRGIPMGPAGSTAAAAYESTPVARYGTPGYGAAMAAGLPQARGFLPPTVRGGVSENIALPAEPGAAAQMTSYREQVVANERAVARLNATQVESRVRFQAAGAAYSDASLALSRHGALTTEFIQAFARGQVTLKEFESQMVSTIGKFSGWLVAGAAVYGVYEALKHVTDGAMETQSAVQNLGRFIPGLGGPAGGGVGQVPAAESAVRDISRQFNVPIKEVADPMQVMARIGPTYHNITDAANATRAVLAAFRLDQVPLEDAERYFTGIAHALNITHGEGLIGVVNSLNALQANFGARVTETLPAIARAAPPAVASGLSPDRLEALAAMGVRAGVTGPQIGTALYRSMTNFAFTPTSMLTYRRYGMSPETGQYGNLMDQVMGMIDQRTKAGTITGPTLRNLAVALAGPQQARSMLPMLVQEMLGVQSGQGSIYQRGIGLADHPRSFQEDLNAILGSLSERFHSVGITLENFGSRLYSAGALAPVTAFAAAIQYATNALVTLVSPITDVLSLFNELPGTLRTVIGALVAMRVGRAVYDSSFGATARGFVARIPGMDDVRNRPAEVVQGYITRLQRDLIPRQEQQVDVAAGRRADAESTVQQRRSELERYRGANQGMLTGAFTPENQSYRDEESRRIKAVADAEERARAATEESVGKTEALARSRSDLLIASDKHRSWEDRAQYAAQRGNVATEEYATAMQRAAAAANAEWEATMRGAATAGGVPLNRFARGGAAGEGAAMSTAAGVAAATSVAAAVTPIVTARTVEEARRGGPAMGMSPMERLQSNYRQAENFMMTNLTSAAQRARAGGAIGRDWLADRYGDAQGFGGYVGRTAQMAREGISGAFQSPWAPMAGMMGAQMVGDTLGGNLGRYVSGVGGTAFGGMMIAQMMGKNMPGGFALGSVMGNFQQSTTAGVGSLAGAGLGLALGGPAGAAIGSLAGGMLGQLFASKPPTPQEQQKQAQDMANRIIGTRDQSQVSGTVTDLMSLSTGSAGTTGMGSVDQQTAQRAQSTVTALINTLTAQVQMYGSASKEGVKARADLDSAIQAAVEQAATDPTTAAQVMQAAQQPRLQAIQQKFQYAMTTTGVGGGMEAANQASREYSQMNEAYNRAVDNASQELTGAQRLLTSAQAKGNRDAITAATKVRDQAQKQYDAATGLRGASRQAQTAADQANYAAAYQSEQATVSASATLQQAGAGGDRMAQLRAALSAARTGQGVLGRYASKLDPNVVNQQQAQLEAAAEQAQQQMVAQGLTEMQSRGAVSEARIPSYDSVGQARQKLKDLEGQYKYMTQNRAAFDPSDIRNMLAQVIQARHAVADAAAQFATQMADINAQIAQAQDVGDSVAQALDQLTAATADLKNARGPVAKATARQHIIEANNAIYQAITSRSDTAYEIAQTSATGNAAQQAAIAQARARYDLSRARGPDERNAALQELAQANVQAHQASQQRIAALGGLAEAQAAGDPLEQARITVRVAQQTLAGARGIDEQIAAEQALAQANYQLHQAQQQRLQEQTDLYVSQTRDPLEALRRQISGAREQLAHAKGPDEKMRDQTQYNDLKNRYEGELISQRESTIDFQLNMQQITTQQAINQLSGLLKLKDLTRAERQQIQQRIRQLQMGDTTSGQFDLAPGNIKMPTPYDVSKAMRGAAGSLTAGGHVTNATAATQINVWVANGDDVPKVADALDRAMGSHVRARLRAAGVRGT